MKRGIKMTFYARKHRLPQRDVEYFCEKCGVSSKEKMLLLIVGKGSMLCEACYNGVK